MVRSGGEESAQPRPRLVVVGARGWIGAAVCRAARARGRDVVGVVREVGPGEDAVDGPLTDLGGLPDLLSDGDATVVNAAGRTSGSVAELTAANVDLSAHVADVCEATGTPLLLLGSAAEYGAPLSERVVETQPEAPVSDYGRSKLEATRDLRARRAGGAVAGVARVFNVLGPGRPTPDPVQEFAASVLGLGPAGGEVRAWDSTLVRDYSSLGWVADRLVDLADRADAVEVVNLCSGSGVAFRALIEAMAAVRGVPVTVVDTRPGGLPRVVGDPTLLRSLVGPAPVEDLAGLARVALGADRLHP